MRADARANRQDLLAAAAHLLQEQGAGMSLRPVAQEAGLGVGTLYRHFPTRRDLLTAVLEQVVVRIRRILTRFIAGVGDPQERWRRLASELAEANLTSMLAALDSVTARDLPQHDLFDEAEEEILDLADRAVAMAAEAGLVGEDLTARHYFMGLLTLTRPLTSDVLDRFPEQNDWLLDVYLRGLRPTAG